MFKNETVRNKNENYVINWFFGQRRWNFEYQNIVGTQKP